MRAEDITYMIRCAISGDREAFVQAVETLARNEQGGGRSRAAEALRAALTEPVIATRMQWQAPADLQKICTILDVPSQAPKLYLKPQTDRDVRQVLAEHSAAAELRAAGLRPAQRILLSGPPGTGKTSTATWIAHALGRRLALADSHRIVQSHLGETSATLAKLFESLKGFDGVVFLDEIDSIGGERSSGTDASGRENARIVNTLLTVMEREIGESIVVAATNRSDLLDAALLRRFDTVIEFPRPDGSLLMSLVESLGAALPVEARTELHREALAHGWSHAEITTAVLRERKRQVLAAAGRKREAA